MPTPGAEMSTSGQKLENDALVSMLSTAPTVIVSGHAAGINELAVVFALPAATTATVHLVAA